MRPELELDELIRPVTDLLDHGDGVANTRRFFDLIRRRAGHFRISIQNLDGHQTLGVLVLLPFDALEFEEKCISKRSSLNWSSKEAVFTWFFELNMFLMGDWLACLARTHILMSSKRLRMLIKSAGFSPFVVFIAWSQIYPGKS